MDYDSTRDHLITVGKDNVIKIWNIKDALKVIFVIISDLVWSINNFLS